MMKLDNFVGMMTGHFDNKDQFNKMQAEGKTYPYAEHVNTICNDKINNLPEDFKGKFVVEESYYEINGKRHASLLQISFVLTVPVDFLESLFWVSSFFSVDSVVWVSSVF